MIFIGILVSYLLGSIPTGYLFARFTKKIDLRKHGSGNVGATNVFRTVGKLPALLTLAIDILKGVIAVGGWAVISYRPAMRIGLLDYQALLGLAVVIGHNWTVFLKFKGGKGVATSAGVLLAFCPKLLFIGICVWLLFFIPTKIVSVASVASAVAIPVSAYVLHYPTHIKIFLLVLAFLILFTHRTNITRLMKGEEESLRKLKVKL